jgi:hypothetical protein
MRRIIREVDPPPPSTRLLKLGHAGNIAARRMVEPARLVAMIRGDVDWVILRCLQKERSRRYDTAGDLAADLGRFLNGEPVEAAPPSRAYRIRKFVRRHRVPVAAGLAVAMALLLGIMGTSAGLVWAIGAEAKAQRHATFLDKHIADLDVLYFGTGSRAGRLRTISTAREILQDRSEQLGFDNRHTLSAMLILARRLRTWDSHEDAEPILREAVVRGGAVLDDDDPLLAILLGAYGSTLRELGRLEEARVVGVESMAVVWRVVANGATPDIWLPQCRYGETLTELGQFEEAEAVLLEAFEIRQSVLRDAAGPGDPTDALIALYRRWHEARPEAGKDEDLRQWLDYRGGSGPAPGS